MQIVIDIPEEAYKLGTLGSYFGCYSMKLHDTILNGTVLPKHGRLGDLDALEELFRATISVIAKKPQMQIDGALEHLVRASAMTIEMITDAPTILERDDT